MEGFLSEIERDDVQFKQEMKTPIFKLWNDGQNVFKIKLKSMEEVLWKTTLVL